MADTNPVPTKDPAPDRRALTHDLGREISRGRLWVFSAQAGLIADELRAARLGDGDYNAAFDRAWAALRLLRQASEHHQLTRDAVVREVRHVVLPMLRRKAPANAILAEAFNVNAGLGWQLTERQVGNVVVEAVEDHVRMEARRHAR